MVALAALAVPAWRRGAAGARPSANPLEVRDRRRGRGRASGARAPARERQARASLGAEAGLGPDVELVERMLGRALGSEHGAEPAADEPERNTDDGRVGEVIEPESTAL